MSVDGLSLDLAKCHFPVRGLGHGRRVGLWLQGCSIGCRGCVVPETWAAGPQHRVALAALLARLLPWLDDCDGVTISGGEPFDQPQALTALLAALRNLCDGDLLIYSGYPWKTLQDRHAALLGQADVIVSEPFVAALREPQPTLMGSTNQRVHLLTPLARQRYADWQSAERVLSIARNEQVIDIAGLLRPGDLRRLAQGLGRRGWDAELTHDAI